MRSLDVYKRQVYILSFVIPSGAYQRDGKMAVPGTYEVVEKTYLNPVDVILAVGDTVYSSFGKLFVTLIIMGGMMGIVNSTGVLDRDVYKRQAMDRQRIAIRIGRQVLLL